MEEVPQMQIESELNKQTVFIIDDDGAVRESIAALVDIRGLPVETYRTAEDFLATYSGAAPGCVITDLRIDHGMTGLELQIELNQRGCEIPVIVISAYANVSTAVQAMHNGAVTLLEKNCSSDDLWKSIVEALATDSDRRNRHVRRKALLARFEQLKPEELIVMERVVSGQLNKTIAKDLGISLRTVEGRRHNAIEKIGANSLPDLVRLYVELEQILEEPLYPYLMARFSQSE